MNPVMSFLSKYVTLGSVFCSRADLWLFAQINAHYEFYDELDLDCNDRALLSETANKTVVNRYRLHSVFVHSGDPGEISYFVFIRSNNKWYKFDDGVVEEATESQAIAEQFGQGTFFR